MLLYGGYYLDKESNINEKYLIEHYINWNSVRDEIFKIIHDKFIKIAIEKGLKEHRKKLIQNNQSYFIDFMKRKNRYLLSEIIKEESLKKYLGEITKKNDKGNEEVISLFTNIILSNNEYKQKILDDIQEFLTFLIVF